MGGKLGALALLDPPARPGTREPLMPRYEIQITDMTRARTIPGAHAEASPEECDLLTVQEAPSEDLAKDWAWRVWDARYGPGRRPAQFRLGIRRVDNIVTG